MPKLVIFDLDDTILHLGIDWKAVKEEIAVLAERSGADVDKREHLVSIGNRLSKLPGMKEAIDRIYLRYESECAEKRAYTVFPAMISIIKELKEKGHMVAIASGNHSSTIRLILSQEGVSGLFDMICGRDMVEKNKPDPEELLLIIERLGADRKNTIFIGDSINDINAAKAAGVSHFHIKKDPRPDMARLRKLLLG